MDTVKETVSKFQIWMFMCAPGLKRDSITAYLSGHWETNKITVILLDFFFNKSKLNYFTDGRMANRMNAVILPRNWVPEHMT